MTLTDIKNGDLTNKGVVKMVDNPWNKPDGTPADRIVNTTNGVFRESELTIIEKAKKPEIEPKEVVDFDTVMSVDIRPGRVTKASRIPKTDKLIHLSIQTALGKKSVVTNLGDTYEASEFVGQTFMFFMNMSPIKMKGVLSEAMIVAEDTFKFNEKENKWDKGVKLIHVAQ